MWLLCRHRSKVTNPPDFGESTQTIYSQDVLCKKKKNFKKEIKSSPYNAIAIRKQIDLMIGVKKKELGKRTFHSYAYILFVCSPVRKVSREEKQKNATHIPCNWLCKILSFWELLTIREIWLSKDEQQVFNYGIWDLWSRDYEKIA